VKQLILLTLLFLTLDYSWAVVAKPRAKKKKKPSQISQIIQKEEEKPKTNIADTTHQVVTNQVFWLANQVDDFFGGTRTDDEQNRSTMRLFAQRNKRDSLDPEDEINVRLNLKFPTLEKKLKDALDFSDDQAPAEAKSPSQLTPKEKVKQRVIDFRRLTKDWIFSTDSSLRLKLPLQFVQRFRVRRNFYENDKWVMRFAEEITWFSRDGWQEFSELYWDRKINENYLFRFYNSKTLTEARNVFSTSHGPSLYHTINDRKALSYDFRLSYQDYGLGHFNLDNQALSLTYRQKVYKEWLFFEIRPSIEFPRTSHFKKEHVLFVKLEGVFGPNR
jgi:hypothetical protein